MIPYLSKIAWMREQREQRTSVMPISDSTPWRARISALAVDREEGAGTIALLAAQALEEGAAGGAPAKPLLGALVELVHGQRAMAPVLRLAADLSSELKGGKTAGFRQRAAEWARELEAAGRDFRNHLMEEIKEAGRWGFYSSSSTVFEGLAALAEAEIVGEAWVGESRPGGEGSRTARRLKTLGWKTTLVPDSRLFDLVASGFLDCLVLGCDAADGERFINKSGSAALAALARQSGVNCELWTTTHKLVPAATLDLLHADETQGNDLHSAGEEIRIDQPLFGIGKMMDANILRTERGRMRPKDVRAFLDSLPVLDTSQLELDKSAR
ncbi:MAG: hypothetical protein V2A56_10020 [bacterium]